MSVIRVKHEKNYVVLQKEILENPKISLKAKGLWAFCMAKPDDWEFHVTQLADSLLEAKDALMTGIKELIKFGYMVKIQNKRTNGQWDEVDYEIFETSRGLKECLPQLDLPLADRPVADNPPLPSIKEKELKKEYTNHQHPPTSLNEKETDDDEKNNFKDESDFEYTLRNGSKASISVSVIFRSMVGLPYSNNQILEAINKARNAGTISDPVEYIKAILSNPKKFTTSTKSNNAPQSSGPKPGEKPTWTIRKSTPFQEPSSTI